MYRAMEEIRREFDKNGLKYSVEQIGGHWILNAGMSGDASTYRFLFIKKDDTGNDVALRVFKLAHCPPERKTAVCRLLNDFQVEYRFVRFVMDDDGDINVEYDFPAIYSPIGEGAVEVLMRLTHILDQCYPKLMRALWN